MENKDRGVKFTSLQEGIEMDKKFKVTVGAKA
jgi:hypothetical protein